MTSVIVGTCRDFSKLGHAALDMVAAKRGVASSDGMVHPDAVQALGAWQAAGFAQAVVRERGWVAEDEVESLLETGFTKQNVLEVILGVSLKTLSNYSNHIAGTPLNPELSSFAWSAAE